MSGFIDTPLGQMLNRFYTKEGTLPKGWQPFLMNKFLSFSFNKKLQERSFILDKYIFLKDKEFVEYMIDISIPRHPRLPFTKYIKKAKENIGVYKPIIDAFQKYYNWTDKETITNTPIIIKQLKDKKKLRCILDSIGAEVSLYRKFKLKVEKPIEEVPKSKSLFSFM